MGRHVTSEYLQKRFADPFALVKSAIDVGHRMLEIDSQSGNEGQRYTPSITKVLKIIAEGREKEFCENSEK